MVGLAAAAGVAAFGVRGPVFVKEFLRPSEAAGVLCRDPDLSDPCSWSAIAPRKQMPRWYSLMHMLQITAIPQVNEQMPW